MGFGFNLAFPFLLFLCGLSVLAAIIVSLVKKKAKPALFVVGGWGLFALIIQIRIWVVDYYKPMPLTKADIEGVYRIDTSFYPGANARWQYEHILFTIDSNLYKVKIRYDGEGQKVFNDYVYWKQYSTPQLWQFGRGSRGITTDAKLTFRIVPDSVMILGCQPILYRSHNRFYYVFENTPWGNLFFRKSDSPEAENW
jgi:hypothetical protein